MSKIKTPDVVPGKISCRSKNLKANDTWIYSQVDRNVIRLPFYIVLFEIIVACYGFPWELQGIGKIMYIEHFPILLSAY